MDTNNEILDAIEILADKKIGENITKILTGICKSVNINNNTCVMDSNGVISTVQFYGSPPEVNELYRIFVPSNNMSRSFIIVPPKFTVNPNLLDNWYFGRPVNQRGKSEYTGSGYTVDRWTAKEGVVSLSSSGLTLQNSTWLDQIIENLIENRIYTISLLTANGVLLAGTGLLNKDSFISVRIDGGGYIDISYHADVSGYYVELARADAAQPLSILAAKLELGPTQTLAHLENGNWVLNEIPKYEDVLSNCQRYAFNVVNSDDNWEILGSGFAMDENQLFCFIPTSTTLRGKPSIAYSGSFRAVRNTSVGAGIVINTMVVDHVSSNGVSVICTSATSFEVGEFYTLWCVPGEGTNSLIFSADL